MHSTMNMLSVALQHEYDVLWGSHCEATARFMKLLASKGKAGIPFEKLHRLKSGARHTESRETHSHRVNKWLR
eukprot:5485361-Amphidinium_carterae.1